tara:strand:+ start:18966 stop:19523 length:558 start_codon:yes stop_codon:yes gene_type:complete
MFKQIKDYPKYEINCEGVIRNINTKTEKYTYVGKVGYKTVMFKKSGKTHSVKVHRLVAEYFLKEPSEELKSECESNYPYVVCVNHIDHDKLNNHVDNLEWCTHAHNTKESWRVGNTPALKGELNGRSVLTEDFVHELCVEFEKGMKPKEAVELFGISPQQATKIRAGYAWKHIWEQYDIKVNRRN